MATILTTTKMKDITFISNNIDNKYLLSFIEMAETFHVQPLMGDLYEDILIKIDDDNLTADDIKFLDRYVYPCIAYYALYEAAPHLHFKTENKGLVKKFSDNSDNIDSAEFKIYRQSVLDKAVMYANRLRKILDDRDVCRPKTNNSTGFFLNF